MGENNRESEVIMITTEIKPDGYYKDKIKKLEAENRQLETDNRKLTATLDDCKVQLEEKNAEIVVLQQALVEQTLRATIAESRKAI